MTPDRDQAIPESWVMSNLGIVTAPSSKRVEPNGFRAVPYLSLEHIESSTTRILGRGKSSDARSTKSVFHAGDVLYGKLRPYLNKVAVPDFDGICSTDILVFPKSPCVESKFLMWFLTQPAVVSFANHNSSGIQLPRTSFAKLAELEFPVPPYAEQQRIVAKLETLIGRVDACRECLEKIPNVLRRFRQSILAAACSGRLTADWRGEERGSDTSGEFLERIRTERFQLWRRSGQRRKYVPPTALETPDEFEIPDDWAWATVDELATKVVDGVHRKPNYVQKGVPFLTVRNLTAGTGISFEDVSYITNEDHCEFIKRANPEKGDVLVTKDGTLGVVRVVDTDGVFSIFVSLALVKPVVRSFGRYLAWTLSAPQIHQRIVVTGTGLQHIHLRDLRAVAIPIPPESEQEEIVRRVEALFALADRLEARLAKAQVHVDRLIPSLLAKAFRGELVATEAELARQEGRSYEPASALLERIQRERSGADGQAKAGTRAQRPRLSGPMVMSPRHEPEA